MKLWHRSKTIRPVEVAVAATWTQLWQQVVRRFVASRPQSLKILESPRAAGIRKSNSPRAKSARRQSQHTRPREPVTARAYIDLLEPVLSDSERLEEANRILSAPGTPLDLRFKAKRSLDIYSRRLREQVNRIIRTAIIGQTKPPTAVLSDLALERLQQYRDVLSAFIRSNVHDLDPYHESTIVQDRLHRALKRLTAHNLAPTNALVDTLRKRGAHWQQERLKAAVYRVALTTCRRHVEKTVKELVNIHAFNATSVGKEPYGPFIPPKPARLGDFDEGEPLRNRWRQVKIDLAATENAFENSGKRLDSLFEDWKEAIRTGKYEKGNKADEEEFNDVWLKEHRLDYVHLQELTKTFKQVRDEAMAACEIPVTIIYEVPTAKKFSLKPPVDVDPDIGEFPFHALDGLTESEAAEPRRVRDNHAQWMRPQQSTWAHSIVQHSDAVSSPPSQASIDRRHVDVIRDHGAKWDCESVAMGESRSEILHDGGDGLTGLKRLKIKAYRQACEAERENHIGHYPST